MKTAVDEERLLRQVPVDHAGRVQAEGLHPRGRRLPHKGKGEIYVDPRSYELHAYMRQPVSHTSFFRGHLLRVCMRCGVGVFFVRAPPASERARVVFVSLSVHVCSKSCCGVKSRADESGLLTRTNGMKYVLIGRRRFVAGKMENVVPRWMRQVLYI